MKLLLLLLFVSRFCLSQASTEYHDLEYGDTLRFYMLMRAQSVDFTERYEFENSVVWKRDELQSTEGTRWRVTGNHFLIINATFKESGEYVVRDRRNKQISKHHVTVITPILEISLKQNERLHFSAKVDKKSCNIIFYPDVGSTVQVVDHGSQGNSFNGTVCQGLHFNPPCQLENEKASTSCRGRYEVTDIDDELALVVNVKIQSYDPAYFAIGGFILAVILISCCATRCFCRGSSTQTKASQPVLRSYDQYDSEPVGGSRNQTSEPPRARNPEQASRTTTGLLIHNPPQTNAPPDYDSVFPLTHHSGPAADPLSSDPEPRFELKGLNFNFTSPLASDSTHSDVYTSEKLNFL